MLKFSSATFSKIRLDFKVTLTQSGAFSFSALCSTLSGQALHPIDPVPLLPLLNSRFFYTSHNGACYVNFFISFCSDIPTIGPYIQKPFKIALEKQKEKLHRKPGPGTSTTSVSDTVEQSATSWRYAQICTLMRFVLFIIMYTTVEEIISEQLLLSYRVVYYAVPDSLVIDEILSVAVYRMLVLP